MDAARRRTRWFIVGAGAIAVAGAVALARPFAAERPAQAGPGAKGPSAGPAAVVEVSATEAKRGDVGVYLDAIGTVTPVHTASVTSQVSGLVTAVHYVEGQPVKVGDPLVELDSRPFRATLAQAEGTLERDQSLLAQARMDLERYRAAWERRAIAKQQLDDQEKLVHQYEGTVRIDEGLVAYDRIQVGYCHITAPIAGRVGLRLVDPGNVLQTASAQTLVVITQMDPITVVFTIPEDRIDRVQERLRSGATLEVSALDRRAQKAIASGRLLTLNNQIDTTTGTVKARAIFGNSDERLFPNQFVNTRLLVDVLHGATVIPAAAIQQNGTTSFVYVLQNGVAHTRKVAPGVTDRGTTSVEGVSPGESIATGSFDRLHEGARVRASTAVGGTGAP